MKRNVTQAWFVLFAMTVTICSATQYQISGTLTDQNGQSIDALMTVAPTNNPTQGSLPMSSSNGTYVISLDVSEGSVVNVSAMRGLSGPIGGYSWLRLLTLGTNSIITNVNFTVPTVPTVNTSVVSVTGRITISGSPPQNHATVSLRKTQLVSGQELQAASVMKVAGLPMGTNTFRFCDLPTGDYEVWGKADSQSWTQIVISVTSSNIPVNVNIDY